jgi:hypothetical protein
MATNGSAVREGIVDQPLGPLRTLFARTLSYVRRMRGSEWVVFATAEVRGLSAQAGAKTGAAECAGNGRELG